MATRPRVLETKDGPHRKIRELHVSANVQPRPAYVVRMALCGLTRDNGTLSAQLGNRIQIAMLMEIKDVGVAMI